MGVRRPWAGVVLVSVGILVSACSKSEIPKQAQLDAISDKCGLPREALRAKGDEFVFQPAPDTNYAVVDCALTELKKMPGGVPKMGFVGNERYADEVENNAQKN